MDWDAVAQALHERMAELGTTQRQLAEQAGVSRTTVKELAGNWRPRKRSPRTLAALSEALDWPSGKLLAVAQGEPESQQSVEEQLADIRARLDKLEHRKR